MTIDQAYRFVNYVANKEQRGNIKPSDFNLLAIINQRQFISNRLGNIKALNGNGVPAFGYESSWKIHEDLRPIINPPQQIAVQQNGNFIYPYGYIWPDSITKTDFTRIKRLTEDQYADVKRSKIYPPTPSYPVAIFRGPYGFVDPYSIGNILLSYVKNPVDPNWDYNTVNGQPVYNPTSTPGETGKISQDFSVNPNTNAHLEICFMILQSVGVNLDALQITQYSQQKEQAIS